MEKEGSVSNLLTGYKTYRNMSPAKAERNWENGYKKYLKGLAEKYERGEEMEDYEVGLVESDWFGEIMDDDL